MSGANKLFIRVIYKFFASNIMFVLGMLILNLSFEENPHSALRIILYLTTFLLFFGESLMLVILGWNGIWPILKGLIASFLCFLNSVTINRILFETFGIKPGLIDLGMYTIILGIFTLPIIGLIRKHTRQKAR